MLYKDSCHRCGGTGQYHWFSMGQVVYGACLRCRGRGHRLYKTSPEVRAKNRAKAQAKREAKFAAIQAEREERAIEAANRGAYTLYLYTLAAGRYTETKKLLLIK